jgi:hypothetical protein
MAIHRLRELFLQLTDPPPAPPIPLIPFDYKALVPARYEDLRPFGMAELHALIRSDQLSVSADQEGVGSGPERDTLGTP